MEWEEILRRQRFAESSLDPSKHNERSGARGIAQITPITLQEGINNGWVSDTTEVNDLFNESISTKFQENYMADLMQRPWIGSDEKSFTRDVKVAKTLAAYNMGPTKLSGVLNDMLADGVDIRSNTDWVQLIPEYHRTKAGKPIYESKDYINKILLGQNNDFEKGYDSKITELDIKSKEGLAPWLSPLNIQEEPKKTDLTHVPDIFGEILNRQGSSLVEKINTGDEGNTN